MVFMWQSLILLGEFIVCVVFAAFVYSQLGSYKDRPWYVTCLTLFGWILCFYIVFLVPNDVAQAAQCTDPNVSACNTTVSVCTSGTIVVPPNVLKIIWEIVYWSTLFLTWGVYPIIQTYSMTGEFTFGDKMRTSIKSNLLLYSVMGAVLAVVGVISIIELNIHWGNIPATITAAANTYGLFLLIAMLGHGLVNVPRRCWRRAKREMNLKRYQFDVARYDANLFDSTEALKKTLKKVRKASEITPETDTYRKYIDIIITKCPPDEYNSVPYGEGNIELSYNKLALLHEKLMREAHSVKMYRSLFNHSVHQAIKTEDILNSKGAGQWKINWTLKPNREHFAAKLFDVIEYFWFCYIESRVNQLLCIATVILSITIVWSELLFSACTLIGIDLSIFSITIHKLSSWPPILLQILIFLPVVYIAWCAYSSLFQLRLFNYYHIVPHHMSDSNSLLFSAAYLCRLTAPMAYNFMQMSHYLGTSFVDVMGTLDIQALGDSISSVTNFGDYFQTFFPVLLLPFILMTLFDVYSKILNLLHIKRFQFTDDFNHSLIESGAEILSEERDRIARGIGEGDVQMEEERKASASRRSTNSRGILFEGREHVDDSYDLEQENAPGGTDEIQNISKSIKGTFNRIFGGKNEEEERPRPQRNYRSEVPPSSQNTRNTSTRSSSTPSTRTTRSQVPGELPSFNLDDTGDLWGDFGDDL